MPKTQVTPNDLSAMLDAVLPPNSNRVYPLDDAPDMVQVAELLTDDTDYQLGTVGEQIMHDRVLTELNTQRANGRYRQIIPFASTTLRLVAGIALLSLFGFGVLTSEPGQPLYAVADLLGITGEDDENDFVTALTVMPTEAVQVTETPTPTQTNTPDPTATFTETPTAIPTDIPTETAIPVDAVIPIEAVVQYVNAVALVYALPNLSADIIATLDAGTALVVTGYNSDGTWAQVFLEDGTTAWMQISALSTERPTVNSTITDTTDNNTPAGGNGGNNNSGNGNANANNGGNNNPPPPNGNGRPPRGGNGRGGRGGN